MKSKTRHTYLIIAITLVILFIMPLLGRSAGYARADSGSVTERYEASNVWNDLQEATFKGEKLDLSIYNFDERKQPQIISFVEFCYSFYSDMQGDFGLYVYVYNPKGADFTKNEELNKISIRYGGNTETNFGRFGLKYLNRSQEAGFEGLFYKFKVDLSESQRAAVLDGVNSTERVYEVVGIELYDGTGANAKDYEVSNKYTYTGYALGYGSKAAETDTLNCKSEGMDVTLTLDVHPTTYMPEGTNGKDAYTRDCLHSVYFSIPNKILEKYGGLAAVHAQWLNAKTAPIYVTGNEDMYNVFKRIAEAETYKGDLEDYLSSEELKYAFLVNAIKAPHLYPTDPYYYTADMSFNMSGVMNSCLDPSSGHHYYGFNTLDSKNEILDYLPFVFYADNGNAADYTLTGTTVLDYMLDYSGKVSYLADPVAGKYYRGLFESFDKEYTDKNVKATDTYSLTSQKISQSWWEKFLGIPGTQVEYSKTFDNIEAIHVVTDEDFKGNDIPKICQNLYIDEIDYANFAAYYTAEKAAQKTTFLFRYYQSKYESRAVTNFERVGNNVQTYIDLIDDNAYLAQMVVNLNFDIIDVTCRLGNVDTVIGVVSDPMDISPNVRPPVGDKTNTIPWWVWIVVAVIIVAIIGILSIIFPPVWRVVKAILKGVFWVIALPFRGLAALFKKISASVQESRERKKLIREEKKARKVQMQMARYQDKLNRKERKYREKLNEKEAAEARKRRTKTNKKKNKSKSKNKKKGKKK